MAAFVEVGSNLRPLPMTATQLAFHHQDVRTPPTMASESQDPSLVHLLAHLESSKQALEHQVQQLLHENRLSKSAKKEQQWHMEGERLHSKLDSLNLALMQKEECIRHLEKEIRDSRGSIQQVQNRCREAERENERGNLERASLQADLEDAKSNLQNLKKEYIAKQDVAEKQRRALESLADKVEKQRVFFENQLEESRRKLVELEGRDQKHELASQHLAEKERQLKSLRDAHEKLLAVHKGKQAEERDEVKEVVLLLESSEAKCEKQKALILVMEEELGRVKKQAHQLDARSAAAEAAASSKSSMLEKVQQELNYTSSQAVNLAYSKAQMEDFKSQVDTLKRKLQDVENTLSEESVLRTKAECALNECKVREKTFLKVEQNAKELKEEVKWKNEQFESLEEAHSKMRDQFHEGLSMWTSEKAAILRDIEVLTENVHSRDFAIHDLRSQVKLLEQSLAHEENCRKLLEFQLVDAKAGFESVSEEYLGVHSIVESLRENSRKELAFLKDTLAEKDNRLKELQAKDSQIERLQKDMMQLEADLDSSKSRFERLQQASEKGNAEVKENGVPLDPEDRNSLMRSLTDAEASIAKREVEMKELEMELDRTRTLSELLRTSLSEAEEKRLEGNSGAMQTLEELSTALSAKAQHASHLEMEVERLQVVVNDVRKCNAEAEKSIKALEDRLRDSHKELQAKCHLSHSFMNIQEHEEIVHAMRSECQSLQRQLSTCEFEKFEIEKLRDKLLDEQKQQYLREKQELVSKLERLGKQCTSKDARVRGLLDQIEREKHVIHTLESRCSCSEQELSKQLLLTDQIREELIAEKRSLQIHLERAQALDAGTAAKDASLQEIKDTLLELTVLCKGGAATCHSQLRISSIEEKLQKQDVLDGQLISLLGEVERVAQGVGFLNIELNTLKDNSKLTKTEFETRLKAVEGQFSSSFAELQEISEQVGKMNAERTSLEDKEEDALVLRNRENDSRSTEKIRPESNADILEDKLRNLVKEAESNKAIIVTLNVNMKAAEAGVATLHEFHGNLKESMKKNVELVNVADQASALQRQLRETEEIVLDKEQRLVASEWAVQQLASEIAKSKSCLAQKDKGESALRDLVERSQADLKVKEQQLMQLQCDLKNAVKTSDDNVALVQQLTLSKDEMGHVLELTRTSLKEKAASLAIIEGEVKCLRETQALTEEALQSCKERLANEVAINSALEQDVKRLNADLERANQEASLADVDVKKLQESLKCVEVTTGTRLDSCERKMEKGVAELPDYQESCAGLQTLIENKDSRIQQLEFKLTLVENELKRQVTLAEQGDQELRSLSERLLSETKMLTSLKVELSTAVNVVRYSDTQKRELEDEVRGLGRSLSVATENLKQKAMVIEEYLRVISQLECALSHQGEAHSKQLQMISSNAAAETDSKVSKLQAALNGAHDELRESQKVVSIRQGEERVLSLRLSELNGLVEKGKSEISQLQADLQLSRVNLDAETDRVRHQVAARNEFESELDDWKRKVAALTKSQAEFESEIGRLLAEINDWKEVAEHTKNLSEMELDAWKMKVASNHVTIEKSQIEVMEWKAVAERTKLQSAELEKSMQAVRESVVGWENMATSLADEGDVAKEQFELVLKQVHDEFRTLHGELANTKDIILITRKEGHSLKAEFLSTVEEAMKEQTSLTATLEGGPSEIQRLRAAVSDLERDLGVWKAKALNSEVEAQSQLRKWSQRAEEWESFNEILEQAFLDFECAVLACRSDAGSSVSDTENDLKSDLQVSFRNLRNEVEVAKSEMLEFKELAAFETERSQFEFQDFLSPLQAEVEIWKAKVALATEEGLQMKCQLNDLIKSLQLELKNFKLFEAQALGEDTNARTVAVAGMEEASDIGDIAINPFHQEDEGCSSAQDNDDGAATQLDGWITKSSLAEGRKLTRQLRASLKHLQFEFESRKQAPRAVQHDSCVNRRDDTGLESLVKALQEEAVEVKAELAVWKCKAHETGNMKQDLEKAIGELTAEVEVWKDRSAMSAGQRIVARRQLDDLTKQVKSLTDELQKWKDVATEANDGAAELQNEVERLQRECAEGREEISEWMQKALELNCIFKDSEEKWKQSGEELQHLHEDVERWRSIALNAVDEGKVTKMELIGTSSKLDDELEVISGNSIGGRSTADGISFKKQNLDCAMLSPGRVSNKCEHKLEISLQEETNGWQNKFAAEEEVRRTYETTIKELRQEVEALQASAACVAEVGQRERVDLANKIKALEDTAEVQGELQIWRKRATDATAECASLRETYDNVIKQLQLELAKWKEKSETATDECQSVRAELENAVQDLQDQARVWKQKAEKALENVVKSQEYEDLIKALEEELCLWMQRSQESKLLQLQLENEQVLLKESLAGTQNELRKWKGEVSPGTSTSIQSLRGLTTIPEDDDEVNIYPLHDEDDDEVIMDHTVESRQHVDWKSRAEQAELLQLQLEDVLAESQAEIHEWKQKTANFSLAAEFLKEELENLVEEGRLEKEEFIRSNKELEAWRERAQDSETQLKSSRYQLRNLEETIAAVSQSTGSLMEELGMSFEEKQLEKQEIPASISALKVPVLVWKEKVADADSMNSQLQATLLETQTELQDLRDKAAVAIAAKSDDDRQRNEKLCITICGMETELLEWKSRAQEGASVQLQLERALFETEVKAGIAATDLQALKGELDRTIAESSSEIQELCTAIAVLEIELSELRESGPSHLSQLSQLQDTLTETQSQLLEWRDKATAATQAEAESRQAFDNIRAETVVLDNFIRALKAELHEWKERAEHLESMQVQSTSSLASSEEELRRWKQKTTEMAADLDLRNLTKKLSQWKEKAQESENLHQQTKESLSEAHIETERLNEQISVLNSFADSLRDELKNANELVSTLTAQLSTLKHNEKSLRSLNQQLETDLATTREEASSRKLKMTQILTQLEGNRISQMGLQQKLHLAQHRLLHSQAENVNLGVGEFTAEKAVFPEPGDNLNPAVGKMRQELSSLKSLVSKLEHVGGNDGEQSHPSVTVAGDLELKVTAENSVHRATSLQSRPEVVSEKEVDSWKAVKEPVHPQIKKITEGPTRARAQSLARFKVLADVNGNSPRACANHDMKLHR